jgi:putative membrane protein
MSDPAGDPRVYFAAERTMLAWLRTGVGIMAFGFVVARFGIFLRLLREQQGMTQGHGLSPYLGATLVGLGAIATGTGAEQFRRFTRTLKREEIPAGGPQFALALSWILAVIGAGLVVILVV